MEQPDGSKVPVDNVCLECRDFVWSSAPSLGTTVAEVATLAKKDGEVKAAVREGLGTLRGAPKAFHPEQVEQQFSSSTVVKRLAVALNLRELRSALGGVEPKGLLVKGIPTMEVPIGGGEKEKVFLFRYDTALLHYKVVEMCESVCETLSKRRMVPDRQYFAAQGRRIYDKVHDERMKEPANAGLQSIMTDGIKTLEHLQELANKRSDKKVAQKLARAAAARPRAGDGESDEDGIDEEEDDDDPEAPAIKIEVAEGACAPPPEVAALAAASSSCPAVGRQPETSPLAGEKRALGESPASEMTQGAIAGLGNDDDNRSVMSFGTAAGRGGSANTVYRYKQLNDENVGAFLEAKLNSLDMTAAMTKGKMGNSRHHAEDAVDKLKKSFKLQSLRLKEKLRVFTLAESLHESTIFDLDETELAHAIKEVSSTLELPVVVCKNLVQYRRQLLAKRAGEASGFQSLLELVFPFPMPADAEKKFNPLEPLLRLLDIPSAAKVSTFLKAIVQDMVVASILDGKASFEKTNNKMSAITSKFELLLEHGGDGLSAEAVAAIADMMATAEFWRRLNNPHELIDTDVDLRGFDGAAKCDPDSAFGMVHTAVMHNDDYKGKLLYIMTMMAQIKELGPVLAAHRLSMQVAAEDDDDVKGRAEVIAACAKDVHRIKASLPEDFTQDFDNNFLALVEKQVHFLGNLGGSATGAETAVMTKDMSKLLADLSNAYPFNTKIPGYMATIGELMLKMQSDSAKNSLMASLRAAADGELDRKALQDLDGILATNGRSVVDDEGAKVVQAVSNKLQQYLLANLDVNKISAENAGPNGDFEHLGSKLMAVVPREPSPGDWVAKHAAFYEAALAGFELKKVYGDIKKSVDNKDEGMDDETWVVAYRSIVRVMDLQKGLEDDNDMNKALGNIAMACHGLVNDGIAEQKRAIMDSIAEEKEFLKSFGGGMADGKHWLDGIPAKTTAAWAPLLTHAQKTVMQFAEAAKLLAAVNKVTKALKAEKDLCDSFEKDRSAGVVELTDLRDIGAVTVVCGALFFVLDKHKHDKAKAMVKTKEQVEWLRGVGLDASVALPKGLWAQASKAQCMKL